MTTEILVKPTSATQPFNKQQTGWLQRQCKQWVLASLKQMTAGYLSLTLPDGEHYTIGSPDSLVHAMVHIQHPDFYKKVLLYGHIGFGEAYMDGDWETPCIESVISWAILNVEQSPVLEGAKNQAFFMNVLGQFNRLQHWLRSNSLKNSKQNISQHYDLSNEFFKLFLDATMTYSSAKFDNTNLTLEAAQLNKYNALCQKLCLKASDHLLEIGTGWGSFALYAATHYGCKITTLTISQEQYTLAKKRIESAGLTHQVDVQLKDYRKITGTFDKVISIEMIEAVGDQFMNEYMAQCAERMKPNGLLAIQMITCPDARYQLLKSNVDFIQKHIFPGSLLPSIGRLNQAINKTSKLSLFSLEDMGLDYAKTLRLWDKTFTSNEAEIELLGFNKQFIRKWHYYFMYCSAAFQMRNISVVQAVYTRPNNLSLNEMAVPV
jgi:cyclopropane-fatty-acyl-phospholipid synthase